MSSKHRSRRRNGSGVRKDLVAEPALAPAMAVADRTDAVSWSDTQLSSASDKRHDRVTEHEQVILQLLQIWAENVESNVGGRMERRDYMAVNDSAVRAFNAGQQGRQNHGVRGGQTRSTQLALGRGLLLTQSGFLSGTLTGTGGSNYRL